jgi:ABC-type transport system involved in multi-copper enzyme maturation permease subunit
MAKAGQIIISFTIWFQFCAVQLVALVTLSNAISEEIYKKTLGVLMTTPITSFQIVFGKLCSKLLLLILLMAVSLPVLAIVRVLGGVPWDYLISSLCITFTTVLFISAVCLLYSIFNKKFYVVISSTILSFGIIFVMMPLLIVMIWQALDLRHTISNPRLFSFLLYFNPYLAMMFNTNTMLRGAAGTVFSWKIHCAIMTAASAHVLAIAVILVRRAALQQAIGAVPVLPEKKRRSKPSASIIFILVAVLLVSAQLLFESFWAARQFSGPRYSDRAPYLLAAILTMLLCAFQLFAVLTTYLRHRNTNTTPRYVLLVLFDILSKLLLMAAVIIPLLAVLRRLSLLPWNNITAVLCAAVVAALFTAALTSLLMTTLKSVRRPKLVITLIICALFVPLLLLSHWLKLDSAQHSLLAKALFYSNPYACFSLHCARLLNTGVYNASILLNWTGHCLITLIQAVILSIAALFTARSITTETNNKNLSASITSRVRAMPVLWKELKTPLIKKGKTAAVVAGAIALFALFLTYDLLAAENELHYGHTQTFYVAVFAALGFLFTIILPATCITTEKEARTWPLLLATSINDYQIILGKFIALCRRFLPVWLILFAHVILFIFFRYIHPIAVLLLAVVITGSIVFLTCTGIYFSNRFKSTTTAVIAHFTFVTIIWILIPTLILLTCQLLEKSDDYAEYYLMVISPGQLIYVLDTTAGENNATMELSDLRWNDFALNSRDATIKIIGNTLFHIALGLFFAWRTKKTLRKDVF